MSFRFFICRNRSFQGYVMEGKVIKRMKHGMSAGAFSGGIHV